MSDINSVVVVARVVEKPVLKYGASGTAVSTIRIANNTYQGSSKGEKVNWFKVTVFGKTAENCEKFLDKGSQIVVNGKLDWSSWVTKDNQKRSEVKIIANTVQFVGGKKSNNNQDQQPSPDLQPEPEPQKEEPVKEEPVIPEVAPENDKPIFGDKSNQQEDKDIQEDFSNTFEEPIDDTDEIPF